MKIETVGVDVGIRRALPANALARNGVLKSAATILKADARTTNKEVKVVNKGDRGVTVDGIYAYEQPKEHLGSFSGAYSNLTLPSRHRE